MTQYLLALESKKAAHPWSHRYTDSSSQEIHLPRLWRKGLLVISTRTIDIPGLFTTKVRNEALCQRIAWISAYFFQGMPSPIKMQPKIAT